MEYKIISVDEAIKDGHYKWNKTNNDIPYYGHINGYVEGFCVEVKRQNGDVGYMSMNAVSGDIESEWYEDYMTDMGLEPTGRAVFRGYYTEYYDPEERETFIRDASKEIEDLINSGHVYMEAKDYIEHLLNDDEEDYE